MGLALGYPGTLPLPLQCCPSALPLFPLHPSAQEHQNSLAVTEGLVLGVLRGEVRCLVPLSAMVGWSWHTVYLDSFSSVAHQHANCHMTNYALNSS